MPALSAGHSSLFVSNEKNPDGSEGLLRQDGSAEASLAHRSSLTASSGEPGKPLRVHQCHADTEEASHPGVRSARTGRWNEHFDPASGEVHQFSADTEGTSDSRPPFVESTEAISFYEITRNAPPFAIRNSRRELRRVHFAPLAAPKAAEHEVHLVHIHRGAWVSVGQCWGSLGGPP